MQVAESPGILRPSFVVLLLNFGGTALVVAFVVVAVMARLYG